MAFFGRGPSSLRGRHFQRPPHKNRLVVAIAIDYYKQECASGQVERGGSYSRDGQLLLALVLAKCPHFSFRINGAGDDCTYLGNGNLVM